MSQRNIDFGSFPDDPSADAIRTAFEKVQQNFTELYTGTGAGVTSVVAGQGIELGGTGASTGTVVIEADIACIQVQTSTLSLGVLGSSSDESYVLIPSSSQILTIDLPANLTIEDLELSGNLTVEGVSVLGNTASANYFIGDGGLLSNLTVSGGTSIDAGTSNVVVDTNSNVRTSVAGNANIFVVTGTGANVSGYFTITGNVIANNLGNVSSVNLDSSNSNVLYGNGVFAAVAGGANTGNVTFDDINVIGTGNLHLQPDPANAGAYLDIYLTAGPDIHISGGSGYSGAVILGTDEEANVAILPGGNVAIQAGNVSGTQTWNFGTDGTTTFPTANVDLHNGGVQSGEVLQFGNPNLQSIITGPTPSANVSAERLIIQGQRGNGTGEGGDVYVWGGDADTNGGDIKIYAGDADNVSAGTGGYVNIDGGDGFDYGGAVTINGGISANGYGGQVSMTGGSGALEGGSASLQGGYGGDGQGGAVQIAGGGGNSQAAYGNVEIGSGTYAWLFDNTGNVRLPGNTFAVNYANGTQVSIGGGGNTGNVTFNDQAVIGTGDQYGGSGLYLAPGTESVGNLQYWRVRGGDVATHMHLDTGNNAYFDQYFGDDGKYVKLVNTGNVQIGSNDATGNSAQWTFDTTGNLTLPLGSIVYETNIPDGALSGSAIALKPIGGTTANQQLLIYPTAADGDHIHMTSGNLYATELFLGSDNLYVKLANTGNVVINSNDGNSSNAMWTFDTDGNLTLPGNLVINGLTNVFGSNVALLQSNPDLPLLSVSSGSNGGVSSLWVEDIGNVGTSNIAAVYANPTSGSGIVRIAVGQNGVGSGPNLWDFGATGNLTLPGNTFAVNYANGTQVSLGGGLPLSNGNSIINIASVDGNITLDADGNIFTLGTDGNLTTPSNLVIGPGAGSGSRIFQYDEGLEIVGEGANSVVQLGWTANTSAPDSVATIAMNYPSGGEGNILIAVGNNATTVNYWLFDNTGNLRLPGNTFAVNYANGTPVSLGGGGGSSITNGTSNVVVESSGNVNTSVAGNSNVFVVTGAGAIVNGNLSVTGNANFGAGSGGNLTGGNVIEANTLVALLSANLGNSVTANFFIGNGGLLSNIAVANITGLGNIATANLDGNSGNVLYGNGIFAAPTGGGGGSSITNGTSNIQVDSSGNVRTSVAGTSNVFVVTGTGANIAGNLDLTGNVTANTISLTSASEGSITGANSIYANFFFGDGGGLSNVGGASGNQIFNGTSNVVVLPSGNVTTSIAGNPNITVATSTGFIVNGVMDIIGNANTSNFNASGLMVATGNVTGGNILTAGTVTASRLISNVAQGTAPFAVSSNTLVANLNANLLNNLTTTTANTGTTIAQRFSNGALAATVFVGNISSDSANQSNITGLGNLTSLIVTGNITGGNLSSAGRLSITGAANSNVGNLGANLLVISGNLTSGNANLGNIVVANYLSVSEDLTVVGNTIYGSGNGGNITGAFLISANYFSGDGSNLTTTNSVNSSVVASGSTQTDANALVNTINIISTVDTGQGVRLPTPTPGAIFYIINISANAVQVYPNTNGVINNLGANNAITHNSNVRLQYVAATTSQWYTLGTL